jgi:hypothetical protein
VCRCIGVCIGVCVCACVSHACCCCRLPAAVMPCMCPPPQAVSKPVSGPPGVGTSRVSPLADEVVDPWADARTHLAGGSPDVSEGGKGLGLEVRGPPVVSDPVHRQLQFINNCMVYPAATWGNFRCKVN